MTGFDKHLRSRGLLLLLLASLTSLCVYATETDNWPSFRGPGALSIADDDPRLPTTWSTTQNVVWKTPIEGLGWSSPVVWGNRVFLTTVTSDGPVEEPRMGLYFPYGSPELRRDADQGRGPPAAREGRAPLDRLRRRLRQPARWPGRPR